MKCINPELLKTENTQKLKEAFNNAHPYRHMVVEQFLKPDVAEYLYNNFPPLEKFNKAYSGLNEHKSEGSNFDDFDPKFSEVKEDIMSKEFCEWMSEITGIKDLFVTDDAQGAGLHQGGPGSFLDIHIDFNIHNVYDYHRRLNLLNYLNKDWKPEYGGDLELWNKDVTECEKKIAPTFNRMVLFETNDISYHGYRKVNLPEGVTRKSIYAYFYTLEREDATGYHDTFFKTRPDESKSKKNITWAKENFKNFTKRSLKKIGINI